MAEFNQNDLFEIGNRIVERREELGMTATELAIQADISARTLSQIESGQREAKVGTLVSIAEALKVSLDYLQPQKLDRHAAIPKEMEALLSKFNSKSPEAQKKILQLLAASIDIMYPTDISRCLDTSEANPDSNHGGVAVVALEPGAASRVGGHIYSDGKSGTLRANAGDNQQAVVVVEPETYVLQGSMIGRADKNGPQGDGINEDVCFTLNTSDRHAIAAPVADHYCTSKNSHHTVAAHEQANTLVASDWKDPPLLNDLPNDEPVYIVRRLTPVECARLQGFPDWWCADLAIPDPTDEEINFWSDVWETWRQLTNPKGKPKTEKQIRKWLADPYTDSAEYKLWGNGISLPIPYFVLSGIAWAAQDSEAHAANCERTDTM